MRKILRLLKNIYVLNFLRRLYLASKYFNRKYFQIIKWGFSSKEDTNFTYHLTQDNIKYLAHTIAVVTNMDYSEIIKYIEELQSDEILKETILTAIDNSTEKKFADKEVRFGRRIGWYAFARAIKPKIIIETGVDKGLGSVVLCAALLRNKKEGFKGKYYGTDINPKAGYFLSGKYKKTGEILYGDSIKSLSKFSEKIDLFINDSDHSSEYEYQEYLTIKPLITDNSIILGDNSHCTSKLADFSHETDRNFIYFQETPLNHWYPGAGIGISYKGNT
ncbi:MAG: class I SAM-dependent methyltransferase [Bacteroidales bacterium]|nr:class I SAM-dependent methyltransferase [Bacteroidales bacterium]